MEKLIYALWAKGGEAREALNARLRDTVAPALLAREEVRGLRLNLQDAAVMRAEGLRMRTGDTAQPYAVAQLWLQAGHGAFREPVDRILAEASGRIAAWSVIESTIIPNRDHRVAPGERTPGWSQFCFLRQPSRLSYDQWLANWQGLHTQVAIDTQANFEYVQNLIARPRIDGPVTYAAIVEECFPEAAMDDSTAFFDAVGDPARYAANTAAMAESCARFIDAGGVDLLPTSQYDYRQPS